MRAFGFLICLLIQNCAPETPDDAFSELELTGHRDVTRTKLGPAKVFDAHHPPTLKLKRQPRSQPIAELAHESGVIRLQVEPKETKSHFELRIKAKPPIDGWLTVHASDYSASPHRWPVRFARAPLDVPAISQARRLAKQKAFDEAEAKLQPLLNSDDDWLKFWAYIELGDVAYKRGEVRKTIEFWRCGAQAPYGELEVGRAAARLRAAAFMAMTRGHYQEAEEALQRQAQLTEQLDDPIGRIRGFYYDGLLKSLTGERLAAVRSHEGAIRASLAQGRVVEAQRYRMMLPVRLANLGRFHAALEILKNNPPLEEAPDIDRALYFSNRGWIAFQAMTTGLIERDYALPWRWYHHALESLRALGHPQRVASHLVLMAHQALNEGDAKQAQQFLNEMPDLQGNPLGDQRWLFVFLKVRLAAAQGKLRLAQEGLREAERLIEAEFGSKPIVQRAEWAYLSGDIALQTGNRAAALAFYTQALRGFENLRRRLVLPKDQSVAKWRTRELPTKLAWLQISSGDTLGALATLELDRAGVVEQLFKEAYIFRAPAFWRRYRDERTRYERLLDKGCAHMVQAQKRALCEGAIRDAKARVETTLASVYEAALGKRALKALSPKALLNALRSELEPNTSLLYLGEVEQRKVALLVQKDRLIGHTDPKKIRALLQRVGGHVYVVPSHAQNGADVFVDGFVGAPQLAGRVSVSFLPYGRVLVQNRLDSARARAVVLANPEGSLLHAHEEGRWVAKALGAHLLEAPTFDKGSVLEAWKGSTIWHFSGHGDELDGPWSVQLRLAQGQSITLEDLLSAQPKGRLAVLNGCSTGRVKGGSTLPAVLLRSGTGSVVATVEKTADGASLDFVKRFYQAGGDKAPGPAFLEAVRKSIEKGDESWRLFRLWGRP